MSAEVETMMSVREVPWHGIGTIVDDKLTAAEALTAAGLDWEVNLEPVFVRYDDDLGADAYRELEGRKAITRNTDGEVFEIVSDTYGVIQNRDAFGFFDSVVESGEAKYETAGALKGGRQIFLTANVPTEMLIGGEDKIDWYLAMASSHDRSLALTAMITPIRVVCKNTLNFALSAATQRWTLKHQGDNLDAQIEAAQSALGLVSQYQNEFEAIANTLLEVNFELADFEQMVRKVYPHKDKGRFSPEQYSLIGVFESSDTLSDRVRHTAWGALNACREWDDWGKRVVVREGGSVAESQLTNSWFGPNVARSNKVLAYLSA